MSCCFGGITQDSGLKNGMSHILGGIATSKQKKRTANGKILQKGLIHIGRCQFIPCAALVRLQWPKGWPLNWQRGIAMVFL